MPNSSLPPVWRTRIITVAVSSGVLVLIGCTLGVLAVVRGDGVGALLGFGIGLALPAFFGGLMWLQVRRYRRNPDFRRRQPNAAASKLGLVGNLVVFVFAGVVTSLLGLHGWAYFLTLFGIAVVGGTAVFIAAKQQDPRLHYFRRPDPLPEGQEPD
jgi:type IV secretory pathway TrbD component